CGRSPACSPGRASTRTPPCWSAPSGPPTPGTASSGPTRRRSTSSTGACGPCSVTRPTRPRAPAARDSTAMPPPSSRAGPCDASPHASPARSLREDPEGGLADQLVGQRVVRRVEAAAADVAVEPLELVALEHPGAAGHVEGDVDDPLRPLDDRPLGGVELRHPLLAVVDAGRPLLDEAVEDRRGGLAGQVHLGHLVLDHRVVGVRAPLDGHRGLAL